MLLAVNILATGIFGSYQTAQAAEIVAGYTALEVIEGILLSFGISLFTTEMITTLTENPEVAQDEYWRETQAAFWADQMEAEYENQRKNGNGSGPTPTPDPTGAEIPSFKEVIQNMKNSGKIVLGAAAGAGVWECMSKAVSSLWNKMLSRADVSDPTVPAEFVNLVSTGGYPYYAVSGLYDRDNLVGHTIYLMGYGSFAYATGTYMCGFQRYNKNLSSSSRLVDSGESVSFISYRMHIWINNLPYFSTESEGLEWSNQQRANADKYKKENIWVHPDLQDTYKNNGKLKYPQEASQPLEIPSIDQLTELANKLKSDPNQSPDAVQELIDQLKQNSNPQPTIAPNPNPDPQPTTIPNPTISPDTSDGTDTDIDTNKYKTDLRLVFPFCIPFDLVHLIQAFEAEPKAPVFEFPVDMELTNPFTEKKILDYHHTFELDMSDFEPVIKILRIFEIIFFIIGLLMITRQQMIKG